MTAWVAVIFICFNGSLLACDADSAIDIDAVVTYAETSGDCVHQTAAFFLPRGKQQADTKLLIRCISLENMRPG